MMTSSALDHCLKAFTIPHLAIESMSAYLYLFFLLKNIQKVGSMFFLISVAPIQKQKWSLVNKIKSEHSRRKKEKIQTKMMKEIKTEI